MAHTTTHDAHVDRPLELGDLTHEAELRTLIVGWIDDDTPYLEGEEPDTHVEPPVEELPDATEAHVEAPVESPIAELRGLILGWLDDDTPTLEEVPEEEPEPEPDAWALQDGEIEVPHTDNRDRVDEPPMKAEEISEMREDAHVEALWMNRHNVVRVDEPLNWFSRAMHTDAHIEALEIERKLNAKALDARAKERIIEKGAEVWSYPGEGEAHALNRKIDHQRDMRKREISRDVEAWTASKHQWREHTLGWMELTAKERKAITRKAAVSELS
jgi:hypothetical protein